MSTEHGPLNRIYVSFMFCHEWGQDERWGAHWTLNIQVVAMHVFLFPVDSQKEVDFQPIGASCFFVYVCVSQKEMLCPKRPRSVWELWGRITDPSRTITDPRWTKIVLEIILGGMPRQIPHSYPFMGGCYVI